ncbi:MAG: hypothetical protein AUI17_02515 [Acidobacteriales bacterium 13_2_20CM_2_55_5]|nr:MAG: hypothetical protein AUI17_02515 [Acidobacteriales bacterium 13_2_20CM_2_55_5]PYX04070.1 MAG: hypothetical protein DMG85_18540 [Acidobacteriota bacterium]
MKKLLMAMLGLTILTGCTSEPAKPVQTEKPKPKTTEAVTGRTAFQKLYISARGWARDAQPYRLESQITADWKGKDGKSAVWRAYFASPSQRGVKPFIWSGSQAPDAPSPGITPGNEDTYNPTNSSTRVFDSAFIKLDSDKTLEVAQKHGGDKILQKNPDNPIVYVLNWDGVTNELIWRVIYGDSPEDAKLRVAVNASNGEFLRVEK